MLARTSQLIFVSLAFGLIAGALDAILTMAAFDQTRDVRWPFLADGVERWSAIGLLLAVLAVLVFHAAKKRFSDSRSARLAVLCALTPPFLVAWVRINEAWLPGKWEPVSLVVNPLLILAAIGLGLLVSRALVLWQKGAWRERRQRWAIAGVFSLGLVGAHAAGHMQKRSPAPDVLVILLDVLRADHLGCYGYERPTSPNIDRLAADSIVFDKLVSASTYTKTSVASIFTGLDPYHHGVYTGEDGGGKGEVASDVLSARFTTLAESLYSGAGMNTSAWVENGHIRDYLGYAQGFSFYADQPGDVETIAGEYGDWADEWAQRTRSFSYLHILDLHGPYDPPAPFLGRFSDGSPLIFDALRIPWNDFKKKVGRKDIVPSEEDIRLMEARYDECLLYVDHWVGSILDDLKARGRYDDTLILVISDHGEGFWEHGFISHSNTPYEELVRVPMIVKMPRSKGAGRRISQMVGHIDILPTLLEFTGLPVSKGYDGKSFLPLLEGQDVESDPRALLVEYRGIIGLRTDHWMYITRPYRPDVLFDLGTDPDETHNCAEENPDVIVDFDEVVQAVRASRRQSKAEQVTLDAETVRSLEALGYL